MTDLQWPTGYFRTHDPEPDNHHSALYLVCPDGLMVNVSAVDVEGVDIARAEWMATQLNHGLSMERGPVPEWEDRAAALRQGCVAANPDDYAIDSTPDGLLQTATMLNTWAASALPANEHGQVPFARAMMESASEALKAAALSIQAQMSALKTIGDASQRSETSFGGSMSEVSRVFQNITRVARLHLPADGPLEGQDGQLRDEHSTVLPTPPSEGGA